MDLYQCSQLFLKNREQGNNVLHYMAENCHLLESGFWRQVADLPMGWLDKQDPSWITQVNRNLDTPMHILAKRLAYREIIYFCRTFVSREVPSTVDLVIQ